PAAQAIPLRALHGSASSTGFPRAPPDHVGFSESFTHHRLQHDIGLFSCANPLSIDSPGFSRGNLLKLSICLFDWLG
ncbi:MAG TPA: hypothetical protein VFX47_07710, partial [Gammaproteobacteria bacterium]|nr:hypothetical protein [Gammaproteobacteria bacterium]